MITTESSTNIEPQVKKRPLRILMVTGIYPTERKPHSGTFIKTVVEGLISEGHYVEVIHPSPGLVPIRYLSAAIQVFFKTLAGRFDIVDGNYGLWCLAARLQWTTPVVANFHGDDLLGTPNVAGSRTKKSLFVVYVSRWLCRFVDEVIVKSEQMKKIAMGDKIHIVPSCVDFDLFHPIPREEARASLNWAPDKYYILFGNDPQIPRKNFPLAQAAVERLKERGISAELVVANGLPQTTLVQYINASNALILTSMIEGSPTGAKEAMACNVPVVTVEAGDVLQSIGHTRGCKVCPRDADALAIALEEALLLKESTTGRTDIAYAKSSTVVKDIISIYELARSKKTR
jgi:glycosyltransferase involved in cell wall biosynthesis